MNGVLASLTKKVAYLDSRLSVRNAATGPDDDQVGRASVDGNQPGGQGAGHEDGRDGVSVDQRFVKATQLRNSRIRMEACPRPREQPERTFSGPESPRGERKDGIPC